MTLDSISINIDELETYEAGAILLALLAYPEPNSDQQREDVQVSLSAQVLRAQMAVNPAWARERQWIRPIYALQENAKAQKALRTFKRRLRDRIVAGRKWRWPRDSGGIQPEITLVGAPSGATTT